jgi:hypothetical protein
MNIAWTQVLIAFFLGVFGAAFVKSLLARAKAKV